MCECWLIRDLSLILVRELQHSLISRLIIMCGRLRDYKYLTVLPEGGGGGGGGQTIFGTAKENRATKGSLCIFIFGNSIHSSKHITYQ